ncbi:uncharacterized protein BDZ99DRAFT_32648 [Mytilinidion resinicola]|uniref:UBX domain-containing protein n=1 Tax=Mytilinidion resinicola TaxID=574789 RepID=A0A6A6YM33_9PEZI|nr:uncharacterized protein BDZ99DRAFT_32648 [Mytilinidion resinicola]KAF2809609.1 hypothetical protein BDZ99DRAFT_32648 [Mytilinidion resinicola]
MATDLEQLLDMGFDKERAQIAVKKTGGLQGAIDWLDKNQEKTIEQIKEEEEASAEPEALKPGETAQSLVCDDCGKRFRSAAQAEFHATKTNHENFSESTEEIKPLTEEEKKAKLEELRAKMIEKKALLAEQDKIDRKNNEKIRLKNTKESHEAKEALEKKERLKEAQAKKREKQLEIDARKRALEKIEADKAERRRKAELEKAARAGQAPPAAVEPTYATTSGPTTSKPASAYTETRLALQTPGGRVTKSFPVETTLFEVAHALSESIPEVQTFTQTFPKKVFDRTDFGQTLKEAGLVPSAMLIVK